MSLSTVSWLELDPRLFSPSKPAAALEASRSLGASRPEGEPWLATVAVASPGTNFFVLSVALTAYRSFSSSLLARFSEVAVELLDTCTTDELAGMQRLERAKGNRGSLYLARKGLLRILLPSRLVSQGKDQIAVMLGQFDDAAVLVQERD